MTERKVKPGSPLSRGGQKIDSLSLENPWNRLRLERQTARTADILPTWHRAREWRGYRGRYILRYQEIFSF